MNTNNLIYLGIDGCKAGWFFVLISPGNSWKCGIEADISAICEKFPKAQHIFIDIPIGLPVIESRKVDSAARKRLSPFRNSSVFPVPGRNAVYAESYPEACDKNFQDMGKKVSKQAWFICPKIKEVDSWLIENEGWRGVIRESHPEVGFWALNGGTPMKHNKKTLEGHQERMSLLKRIFEPAEELYQQAMAQFRRKVLVADDILDAICLAVMASHTEHHTSIPGEAEYDQKGLPMEMVFSHKFLEGLND
ncbi:MAG: DUF429 domain-containing protein [Bacteroidota bacterium]